MDAYLPSTGGVVDGDVRINGDATFNKIKSFEPPGSVAGQIHVLPYVPYTTFSAEPPGIEVYFKALIKWVCDNCPNESGIWVGQAWPAARYMVSLYIYNTNEVDANGYPRYANLVGYCGAADNPSQNVICGFSNYIWSYRAIKDALPITGGALTGNLQIRHNFVKGNNPSSSQYRSVQFLSSAGTAQSDRLGLVESTITTNGTAYADLHAYSNTSNSTRQSFIRVTTPPTGNGYAQFFNVDNSSAYLLGAKAIGGLSASTTSEKKKYLEIDPLTQGFIISVGGGGHNGITPFRATSVSTANVYNIGFNTSTATNYLTITASQGTVTSTSTTKARLIFENKNNGNTCYCYGVILGVSGGMGTLITTT